MEKEKILKALSEIDKTFYSDQYCVIESTEETQNIVENFTDHTASSMKNGSEIFVISLNHPYSDEEDINSTLKYCECYTGQ